MKLNDYCDKTVSQLEYISAFGNLARVFDYLKKQSI